MIPYIELHTFDIGPLTIQVWGTMVALGFVLGAYASTWYAKKKGLETRILWDALVWVVVGALILGRFFYIVFYEPAYFFENPLKILTIWEGGFSIIGGFLGSVLFGLWFLSRRKVKKLPYFDAGIFGLPLGLFIGRIGCTLIHDHPGTATNFFLGIEYPDGIVRHDHGFYLSLNGLLLFILFVNLSRFRLKDGIFSIVFLIWYGIVRFFLDFLRAADGPIIDSRYYGLTPAQYASIVMIGIAIYLIFRLKYKNNTSLA